VALRLYLVIILEIQKVVFWTRENKEDQVIDYASEEVSQRIKQRNG
jgi:hypothetical protein